MKKRYFILLFCCAGALMVVSGPAAYAQGSPNPFELLPRVEQEPDTTGAADTPANPFDLVNKRPDNLPSSRSMGFTVERSAKPLTAKEKTAIYQRFLFITIATMMIILTLVVTVFRIFISKIWKAFFNDNILNQLLRERSTGVTLAYLALYLMFFVNAGIFTFLSLREFDVRLSASHVAGLFACIGGVAAFFAAKHLLLHLVKAIFPIDKEVSAYNFTILIFNIIFGFLLVVPILLIAYGPDGLVRFNIFFTLGLLLAALAFRALRGLFIATRFFAWHKFHFFLYLCTVEIAPVLVTIKLLGLH